MKWLLCLFLVLLCSAMVLSQDGGPERPHEVDHTNPHAPTDPERPHEPTHPKPPVPNDPERPVDPIPADSSDVPETYSSDESSSGEIIYVCTMMLLECPDKTYATQNERCEYICGSAPVGGLSWSQVDQVRYEFVDAYGASIVQNTIISSLAGKSVVLSPSESYNDLCIDVTLVDPSSDAVMPAVFHGVRIFYVPAQVCSPILCPDGSMVSCNEVCPSVEYIEDDFMFWPLVAMGALVVLSACCCCLKRKRRNCKVVDRPEMYTQIAQTTTTPVYTSEAYPSELYGLLKEEPIVVPEEVSIPMMMPMMYPPMPPVPPHMMMPNGMYPIMMQGPDGMWYPVMPQQQN